MDSKADRPMGLPYCSIQLRSHPCQGSQVKSLYAGFLCRALTHLCLLSHKDAQLPLVHSHSGFVVPFLSLTVLQQLTANGERLPRHPRPVALPLHSCSSNHGAPLNPGDGSANIIIFITFDLYFNGMRRDQSEFVQRS